MDIVYIDAAKVDLAPTVSLNVSVTGGAQVSSSWVGSAATDWSIKGVEVQYREETSSEWQIIQGKTGDGDSSFSFTGQPGRSYIVRARPWQTRAEPYNGDVDMPGLWVEESVAVGGAFAGYVWNNFGLGLNGALVSTTDNSSSSDSQGFYSLVPLEYGRPYVLTASADGYLSPPPIGGTVADSTSVTPINFTLKPFNDAITNGDFESDVGGWNLGGAGTGVIFSGDHRSGAASLELTGPVSLTQVVSISGAYNPTLSFWLKPALSGGNTFQVILSDSTSSVSRTFTAASAGEWQHAWLPLNQPDTFREPLTVSFVLTGSQVFLDEVSLGDGPHTVFFPIIHHSAMP